ncbi:cytochrome c551 [Metabacillus arenae]|uniref:Cytochrome c n=1 Tax=Metabacillus arenae TaxID=2771434 RepID=A0A926RY70_9BACI|nr:cytochrome c [Metabacillus arenae]MBD1381410.1 cytochrome c [Metabacillus arenae]
MKTKFFALLLGTSIVLTACGGGEEESADNADKSGEVASGEAEEIFQQNCISCHGQNLEGGVGPELATVGGKYNHEEIEDIINNGKGQMQGGIIEQEQAKAVAKWLSEKK